MRPSAMTRKRSRDPPPTDAMMMMERGDHYHRGNNNHHYVQRAWRQVRPALAHEFYTGGFFTNAIDSVRQSRKLTGGGEGGPDAAATQNRWVRRLRMFNMAAALVHFGNTIGVIVVYAVWAGSDVSTPLTVSRLLIQPGSSSSDTASMTIGGCLADSGHYSMGVNTTFKSSANYTCSPLSSQSGNGTLTIHSTPYPARTNFSLNLGALVIAFFALSSVFQFAVMWAGKDKDGNMCDLYKAMFELPADEAETAAAAGKEETPTDEETAKEPEVEEKDTTEQKKKPLLAITNAGVDNDQGDAAETEQSNDDDEIRRILTINWLRYVEYSVSASLMMLCVSLVAGIVDMELLMCFLVLTWGCMLAGWGAEVFLRMSQVLGDAYIEGIDNTWKETLTNMRKTAYGIGLVLHFVGWVFIIVPWVIIMAHNSAFWDSDAIAAQCATASPSMATSTMLEMLGHIGITGPNADSIAASVSGLAAAARLALPEVIGNVLKNLFRVCAPHSSLSWGVCVSQGCTAEDAAAQGSVEPPAFVAIIMWSQLALFCIFGVVQIFQFVAPWRRMAAEAAYIALSLGAKTQLGWMIAANLFVRQ
jgi:hypothetical protein